MDLTIIIPTYQRPVHLGRLLRYFVAQNVHNRLLILDSSPPAKRSLSDKNIDFLQQMPNASWHTLPEQTDLTAKILAGLEMCNTKYIALCGDDDLLVPASIKSSVEFLENHTDYVCAQGSCIYFETQSPLLSRFGKKVNYTFTDIGSISDESTRNRLLQHLRYNLCTFYGVHRHEFLQHIFKIYSKLECEHFFQEFVLTFLTAYSGKIHRAALPYEFREVHEGNAWKAYNYWEHLAFDPKLQAQTTSLCHQLAAHLSEQGMKPETATEMVNDAMVAWMARFFTNNLENPKFRDLVEPKISEEKLPKSSSESLLDKNVITRLCFRAMKRTYHLAKEHWKYRQIVFKPGFAETARFLKQEVNKPDSPANQ